MTIKEYTVLITFDLNYADSSDYRLVNSYLNEKGFEQLSHKGNKLPSNTYLGFQSETIGSYETEADGAERVKNSVYRQLKNIMSGAGLMNVVFVMVAPKNATRYSCSNPNSF
ncbi:hypothetical protein HP475_15155 [Serratia marcescens]|uniref:hypothetical protein n=1 Tax=Serratia marcescens TaxID=615 RepID=UPI0015D8E90F|nr:hypothetical protein [Serratia marcescens]QLJ61172.1 hypothetical protein HP475_15155 [Serratia marcescens]